MRKFDFISGSIISIYLVVAILFLVNIVLVTDSKTYEYKIEVNRIQKGLVEKGSFANPDLREYRHIEKVSFINVTDVSSKNQSDVFYEDNNGTAYVIKHLYDSTDTLLGYVRYDYVMQIKMNDFMFKAILLLSTFLCIIIGLLIYVRQSIIRPFAKMSNIPYALAKGRFDLVVEEQKNKYLGKFLWGIGMLQAKLGDLKKKELKLEKEKKLLLLSISHDIKTPLNTIKLCAKSLEEEIYDTKDKEKNALLKIQEKTEDIEKYVKDIVHASSEDILEIKVEKGEFYLKEFVDMVKFTYKEKCSMLHIDFTINEYHNCLIKGDIDRSYEVIANILENAIKYGDGRKIDLTFYKEEYCQLVKIHNTGAVVNDQDFNHIFDSFYRGNNAQGKEGNGLGLYICKYIMNKMDGDVFTQISEDGMDFILVFAE